LIYIIQITLIQLILVLIVWLNIKRISQQVQGDIMGLIILK